jgi:hypothetical protein
VDIRWRAKSSTSRGGAHAASNNAEEGRAPLKLPVEDHEKNDRAMRPNSLQRSKRRRAAWRIID